MIKSLLPLMIFVGCILSACYPDKENCDASYLRWRVMHSRPHPLSVWLDDEFLKYDEVPLEKLSKYDEVYRYICMDYDTNIHLTVYRTGASCSYSCKFFSKWPNNCSVMDGYDTIDFADVKGNIPFSSWADVHNVMQPVRYRTDQVYSGFCGIGLVVFAARINDSVYSFSVSHLEKADELNMKNTLMSFVPIPNFDSVFRRSKAIEAEREKRHTIN